MKKSPSTPNLNWRYAMTEVDLIQPKQDLEQQPVVRRRQRKVQRPRPRSEIRLSEETWIDGDR